VKKKIIFIILLPIILTTIGLILKVKEDKSSSSPSLSLRESSVVEEDSFFSASDKASVNEVCFKNNCFKVELAVTLKEQEKGLMFRKNLNQDEGMLFVFKEEGEHPFWMKDTLIPLDIIWINQNKEVVFISENTQPCSENHCVSINPDKEAQYVLELKGGRVRDIGLKIGDKMDIKIFM